MQNDDSIMEIKNWLLNKGIKRMDDITVWDANGSWVAWSLPPLTYYDLENCSIHKNLLFDKLNGLAPIHRDSKYSWGWGIKGSY